MINNIFTWWYFTQALMRTKVKKLQYLAFLNKM